MMHTIKINAQGAERKRLVKTISEWLGEDPHYCGAPSFAYEIGRFTVEKEGNLTFSEFVDEEVAERLLHHIYDEGFEIDQSEIEEEVKGYSIQIPAKDFGLNAMQNLRNIIESKATLFKKVFQRETFEIAIIDDRLDFAWFSPDSTPEELQAYMKFITALCNMAKTQTRISAKEKEVENEKYAFRCFLLRLGFIGEQYKTDRKVLLQHLEGSSAHKNAKEVK